MSDFYVSQGNAATYLRCGGYANMGFVGNLVLFAEWQNFENPSRTDKVVAMVRVAPFYFDSQSQCINSVFLKNNNKLSVAPSAQRAFR